MTRPHLRTRRLGRAAALLAPWLLAGCSLLTIKSPETPLSPREQEARLLTRDYAAHFAVTIARLIDDAESADDDPVRKVRALRLKLGAVTEITRASTGLSPLASLIDTWAFSEQLRDYFAGGAGVEVFGDGRPEVRLGVAQLAAEADELARRVAGADYARYHAFVADFVAHHPLTGVDLARPSVLSAWSATGHDMSPLREAGTVAQALGDVSDRLRIYSERVPSLSLWQAELALDRAGFDDADYRTALRNADARLERISRLADASPELAHEAIANLRGGLRETTDRLDGSALQMLKSLRAEREALAADIASEREHVTAAFDAQREKLSADAAQMAARAVDTSWRELRKLVREALLLAILLALVMLGLPFAAGYAVGRRPRGPRADRSS